MGETAPEPSRAFEEIVVAIWEHALVDLAEATELAHELFAAYGSVQNSRFWVDDVTTDHAADMLSAFSELEGTNLAEVADFIADDDHPDPRFAIVKTGRPWTTNEQIIAISLAQPSLGLDQARFVCAVLNRLRAAQGAKGSAGAVTDRAMVSMLSALEQLAAH